MAPTKCVCKELKRKGTLGRLRRLQSAAEDIRIYGVFIIGALALMPDLSLWRRLVFLAAVLVLAGLAIRFHSKFIPNIVIYFAETRPSALRRAWPQILSWIVTTLSGLVAAIIYGLLRGDFPRVTQFIVSLFE